jgi:hypothetical protein
MPKAVRECSITQEIVQKDEIIKTLTEENLVQSQKVAELEGLLCV